MWELLVNDAILEVGDRLRHKIIYGDDDKLLIQEYEIISVEKIHFSAKLIKINEKGIIEQYQLTWIKEISKLNELGFEKYVEQIKK